MVTAGADINNIGIQITPLFNRFIIINNIFILDLILKGRCHGASCMQANGAEGGKTIDWGRKEGERRKGVTRANTVIYSNKGGLLPKP